jgi:hypothetical protein
VGLLRCRGGAGEVLGGCVVMIQTFREIYPNLYRIVRRKDDTVANVLGIVPLNVSFRRGLVNENQNTWFGLVSKVVQVHHSNEEDVFRRNLSKNGMFIVRSMY